MRRLQKITLSLLDLGNDAAGTPKATPESTPQRLQHRHDGSYRAAAAQVAAAVASAEANTGFSNGAPSWFSSSSSSSQQQQPQQEHHTNEPSEQRNRRNGRSPSPAPTAASEGSAAVASIQRAAARSGMRNASNTAGAATAAVESQDYPRYPHSMPGVHVAPSASSETTRLSSEEADGLGEMLKDSNGTMGNFGFRASGEGGDYRSGHSGRFGYGSSNNHEQQRTLPSASPSTPSSRAALAQQEALLHAANAANRSFPNDSSGADDTEDAYGYEDDEREEGGVYEIDIETEERASEEYPLGYCGEGYPARHRGFPPVARQQKPHDHQQQHYAQSGELGQEDEDDETGYYQPQPQSSAHHHHQRGGKFDVEYYEENGYADDYDDGDNEEHNEEEIYGKERGGDFGDEGLGDGGGEYYGEEVHLDDNGQRSRDHYDPEDEAAAERFNFGDDGYAEGPARARADSEDVNEVSKQLWSLIILF